jgi:tetratricopeptide (TPR) repeat protein
LNEMSPPVSNRPVLLRLCLIFALLLPVAAPLTAQTAGGTLTEKTLRDIVAREKALFARAEREGDHLDEAFFAAEARAIAASYDVLIQKSPDFAAAYVAYGVFLGKIDMSRAAVAMLLKANKLDPDIPLVKNQLAKHLAEDGKPLDALPYLTAAIELAPKEPLYHFHLGQLLREARADFIAEGGWTPAAIDKAMLEAYQRAADLAPGELALAYQHAKAYYAIDPPRWEEALGVWEKIAARTTAPAAQQLTRLHRANILVRLGRTAEARALLDQVTDLDLVAEKQQVLDALAEAVSGKR